MRELDRQPRGCGNVPRVARVAIVGRGRLGSALARALTSRGYQVLGPLGRGAGAVDADAVLLCVPDHEIAAAAKPIPSGVLVGHCSGATGLDPLVPHERFSLHPLMTVTAGGARFSGAGAAVAGSTPRALAVAAQLADALQMRAIAVADEDRAAYHAGASIASNFVVTLLGAAERLAASAGISRELLAPLVTATVDNWVAVGASRALTGPVARGDRETVLAQRAAVAQRAGDLLELFDALVRATEALCAREGEPA